MRKPTAKQLQNRIKWAEALESGKYNQCFSVLRAGNDYCCLGVACDVLGMKAKRATGYKNVEDYYFGVLEGDVCLPTTAVAALGISSWGRLDEPVLSIAEDGYEMKYTALYELNDIAKWDFKQIAAVIREQFINPWITEDKK